MKQLKKATAALLILACALSLFSCGSFKDAVHLGTTKQEQETQRNPATGFDDDPTNDFTVTLRLNGKAYAPSVAIDVYWSDGYDIFIAPVDETGVARIDGLDGDYQITLSTVPTGCAYDSNAYTATNLERNVYVDLYDLNAVKGKGTDLYGCYEISKAGIYSVTISEPGEMVYFEFAPQVNGTYTVESWASVVEDEINPIAVAYYGSTSYKHSPYTVEGLGAVGSFTRNFVHTVEIADQVHILDGIGAVVHFITLPNQRKDFQRFCGLSVSRKECLVIYGATAVPLPRIFGVVGRCIRSCPAGA